MKIVAPFGVSQRNSAGVSADIVTRHMSTAPESGADVEPRRRCVTAKASV